MTQNIQDILGQGSKLDRMTEMSAMLSEGACAEHCCSERRGVASSRSNVLQCAMRSPVPASVLGLAESKAYHKRAKDMYFQALLRKYLPFIAVGVVLLVVLYLRWRFY